MRKKLRTTTKYVLAVLVILATLITPFAVLRGFAAEEGPRVGLEWDLGGNDYMRDGVAYSGVINGGYAELSLKVVLEGSLPDGEEVTVSLERYGISASRSDFSLSRSSVTLSNESTWVKVKVLLWGGSSGNRLDIKHWNKYYTPLCGIRIKEVTGSAAINFDKRDVVCAIPYSTSYTVNVLTNGSFGYYETGDKLSDYSTDAWVFSDLPAERSGKFNDMPDRVKEKKYDWSDAKALTVTVSPLTEFDKGEIVIIRSVLQGQIDYYYRVYGKVTDEKAAAAASVWWKLYHGESVVSENNMGDPGGNGEYLDAPMDGSSVSVTYFNRHSDLGTHKFLKLDPGTSVSLTIWNNSDVYDRLLSDFNYRSMAVDNTAPVAVGYEIPSLSYTQGDHVYLTVYFSENVQVLNTNMRLKTLVNESTDGALMFDYFSGTGTNALVFRATLDSEAEFGATDLRVVSFQDARVADLGWNGSSRNNFWDVPKDKFFDYPIATVSCNIDTRLPSVSVKSSTEGIKKEHSVTLGFKKIGNGTTLSYLWSESATPDASEVWTVVTLSGECDKTFKKAEGTGKYYLHVRVTGASRRTAEKTVGPLSLDNSPPGVHSISVDKPSAYVGEHTLTFSVSRADYEAATKSVYLYYKGNDGVLNKVDITDAAEQTDGSYTLMVTATNRKNKDGTPIDSGKGLIELSADSFGSYRIGIGAEDTLGNAHSEDGIVWFGDMVMFDNRPTFEATVSTEADVVFQDRTVYYNTGSDGSDKRITVSFNPSEIDSAPVLLEAYKDGVKIYTGGSWQGADGSEFGITGVGTESDKEHITLDFNSLAVGTYELIFTDTVNGKASEIISLFMSGSDEVTVTENYEALFKPGRLLNNRVWQIATKYYYAIDNSARKTYALEKAPIFSSREKAEEYVRYMEYKDVSVLYIGDPTDPDAQSVINALNQNGLNVLYNKAPGQEDVVAGGYQIWLRYKSPSFEPSGDLDTTDWVYYFMGGAASSSERVKVTDGTPELPELLREAIEKIVDRIVGEDGWTYLTANNPGGTDGVGQPAYDLSAIYLDAQSFKKESVYDGEIAYIGDPEIYGETVLTEIGGAEAEVALVKHYTASFTGRDGRIYYRLAGSEGEYGIITSGDSLAELITSTGIYEFVEFGRGYKKYYVYVDNSAPVVEYDYERAGEGGIAYLDSLLGGSFVRASTVTLRKLLSVWNYEGGMRAELDPDAYLYITNAKGLQTHFYTLGDLDGLLASGGVILSPGIHNVYVYDRLGNGYGVELKINSADAEVVFDTSSPNQLRISINRTLSEIEDGSFAIYYNDELLTSQFVQEATYDRSGIYRVVFEDIYGTAVDTQAVYQRVAPDIKLSYYDSERSRYIELVPSKELPTEIGPAFLQLLGETSYYLVADMTVRMPLSSACEVTVISGEPSYTLPTLNDEYMYIESNGEGWVMKISYKKDPNTFVILSCIPDTDAPEVSMTAKVPEYRFSAREGVESVLVELIGETELMFSDGAVRPASSLTFSFSDVNPIYAVTLTYNGGEPIEIDPSLGELTVTQKGSYELAVTDIVGNTAIRTITISDDFALDYFIDGEAAEYKDNPLDYIVDGEYLDTQYTGSEVAFNLEEAFSFAILYKNGTESVIQGFQYDGESIALYTLDSTVYDEENLGSAEGVILTEKIELDGTASSGTLYYEPFVLNYRYEDGLFRVIIPECERKYEFWQIRISDISDVKQRFVQLVRSNTAPELKLLRENGAAVNAAPIGFIGVNTAVTVDPDSLQDGLISILSYYSPDFTADFSGIEPTEIYTDGAVQKITAEGYYRLVAINRYGNTQTLQFKISLGLNVSVDAAYHSGLVRRFEAKTPGEYAYKSNGSFNVRVWNLDCEVRVTKDGEPVNVTLSDAEDYIGFSLTEAGEYELYVIDDCNNEYHLTLSLGAPVELEYKEAYLTGFNELAIKRSEHYTNRPVSVVLDAILEDGICAVWVESDSGMLLVYDTVSDTKTEYTEQLFKDAVGRKGDGVYRVVFQDEYGNEAEVTVSISTEEQLKLSRLIQSSALESGVSLADAISIGLWTNRRATLTSLSEVYTLTVDGEAVYPEGGRLNIDFPLSMSEGDLTHRIEYTDEYGNRYTFDLHLYRKVPEVKETEGTQLIDLYGSIYSRSPFGYTWDSELVRASYTKDGRNAAEYEKGTSLTADGTYVITFIDLAGNQATRAVTVDTVVNYRLQTGEFEAVYNGVSFDGNISVKSDEEEITVVKVIKDGEELEEVRSVFSEHGSYEVTLMDAIGNTVTVSFSVYKHPVKSFTFTAEEGYAINQVWLYTDGFKISYAGEVVTDGEGNQQFTFAADGRYELTLLHILSGSYVTFDMYIDNVAPSTRLEGVEEGGSTRGEAFVSGLTEGDTVKIYKDGELKTSYTVHSANHTTQPIDEPGEYRVVISDAAGNTVEYSFTRAFTTNRASNIVIILLLVMISAAGLVYLGIKGKKKIK